MNFKVILTTLLLCSSLFANDSTRTEISFDIDENGNMNPVIFIPVYYGSDNRFFSGLGYTSASYTSTDSIDGFSDSKNALVSSSHDLLLNYITYQTSLFGMPISLGAESTFSKVKNNEFGYIQDSNNNFKHGSDYYLSFDNTIDLNIYRHAIRADIIIPLGKYLTSRAFTSISPYTTIGVKQSTMFKPLVSKDGTSTSSTVQDIAYNFRYEMQTKLDFFVNLGFTASYNFQPLKYNISQIAGNGTSYYFENTLIDTNEITTSLLLKVIMNIDLLGGLKPALGFGVKYLDVRDNLTGKTTSTNNNIFTFGIEKRF